MTTKNVICEECDSEYYLKFEPKMVSGDPVYCPFCGEEASMGDEEGEDWDDDDEDDNDDDEEHDY